MKESGGKKRGTEEWQVSGRRQKRPDSRRLKKSEGSKRKGEENQGGESERSKIREWREQEDGVQR